MTPGRPAATRRLDSRLQPVGEAIARGLYGAWSPSAAQRQRLEQIFPTGVCDYTRADQGRPTG